MKTNSFMIWVSTVILACSFFGTSFAGDAAETFALEDVLARAYRANSELLAQRKKIDISLSKYKQTKAWINPEFEFEAAKFPKDIDKDPRVNSREIEGELRYTQPFEALGKRGIKGDISRHEIDRIEAGFQGLWFDVARQIKERYAQTLLHEKTVALAKENLELSRRLLDQVLMRFNAGEALQYEVSRSKLEEKTSRNALLAAEKQVLIDRGRLNILMGREMSAPLILSDTFNEESMDYSFAELLKAALLGRKDVYSQEKEVEKNILKTRLAKRKHLPDFSLSVFTEREDEVYSGGAGVAFELPLWNTFGAEVEEARLREEMSKIDLQTLKNRVSLEVYVAFQEVDLAEKTVGIFKEAMHEANEILRLSKLGYEEGEIIFLSYLESLTAYRQTKQSYFEALSNYARKLAVLEQAAGFGRLYEEGV